MTVIAFPKSTSAGVRKGYVGELIKKTSAGICHIRLTDGKILKIDASRVAFPTQ